MCVCCVSRWFDEYDPDEERAPNSVLQRAILVYINKVFPDKAQQWKEAEVNTRTHKDRHTHGDIHRHTPSTV